VSRSTAAAWWGSGRCCDSDKAALEARAIEASSSVVIVDWTAHPGPLVLDERSGSSVWRRG
jgi:hypothetical protein